MHSVRSCALVVVVCGVAAAFGVGGALTAHAAAPAATCASSKTCFRELADALQVNLPEGTPPCPASGAGASCSEPASAAKAPGDPSVEPSVPVSTIRPAAAHPKLTLESSEPAVSAGGSVVLTAAAGADVVPAGASVEIFDVSTETMAGSCPQDTPCRVTYSASVGLHAFQAFVVTAPGDSIPVNPAASSAPVSVAWVGVSIATSHRALGPGRSATLTATSTVSVERFGYTIRLFDASNPTPITFCSRGTTCSVAVADSLSATRSFAASVGPATSNQVAVTWLAAGLTGTTAYRLGDAIHLDATANADLTDTPWSLGILDDQGQLVGPPCKTGASCSADIAVDSTASPRFTAVVGAIPRAVGNGWAHQLGQKAPPPTRLNDIQAQSPLFAPTRLLWGVDSCKAFTGDPTGELYGRIASGLGAPDFWGRYLTQTACPAISASEVVMAHTHHMAILPIYNDYDCSNVAGYDTAFGYASAAVAAAQNLHIPEGRALAIDIEPPGPYCSGNVDDAFVRGWYDGVTAAGYVPVYYGNGTSGSAFATAYCSAQADESAISTGSFIWSFEPSLYGGWSKSNQPGWAPNTTGCPDNVGVWQYQIDVNSPNPDVDGDEALLTLPLWHP